MRNMTDPERLLTVHSHIALTMSELKNPQCNFNLVHNFLQGATAAALELKNRQNGCPPPVVGEPDAPIDLRKLI